MKIKIFTNSNRKIKLATAANRSLSLAMTPFLDYLLFAMTVVKAAMVEIVVPKLCLSTTEHQDEDDLYPDKNCFPDVTVGLDEEWELVSRTVALDNKLDHVPHGGIELASM